MAKTFVALMAWLFGWVEVIVYVILQMLAVQLALICAFAGIAAASWVYVALYDIHPLLGIFIGLPVAYVIFVITVSVAKGLMVWPNPGWPHIIEGDAA